MRTVGNILLGCFLAIAIFAFMVWASSDTMKVPPAQVEVPPLVQHRVEKNMPEQSLLGPSAYVLTVDDCEYIVVIGGQGVGIAHKANCANPIHQEKKGRAPDAGVEKTRANI